MTVTASKHGLRKAAQERTTRHAQRTPLPPRGGVIPVEVPDYAEAYGRMTQPQLRKALLEKFGQKSANDCPKGKLLEVILRKEREQRAEATQGKGQTQRRSATSDQMKAPETREDRIRAAQAKKLAKRQAEDAALPGDSRSTAKAAPIREVMIANGWSTTLIPAEDTTAEEDVWELTGKRGDEVLWISWTQGTLTVEPMPSYTIVDRTIKLRNASAVRQHATRAPEVGTKELARVSSNRFFRKRPTEPKRLKLPFDPALATDEEVLAALTGKAVAWHNRHREIEESAIVGVRGGKQPVELRPYEGERVLWFCCPQTGFRTFRLSALTKVGSPSRRTKGQRTGEPVGVE